MDVKRAASPASSGGGIVALRRAHARRTGRDAALYDVVRFIRPLYRALAQTVTDRLEGTGVTLGTRAVLEVLDAFGPQTVPQVGRVLALGRQPVQRTINAARELGLVERVENPAHKRSCLVGLTAEGQAIFHKVRVREQDVLRRIARRIPRADIEACIRVLTVLNEQLQSIALQENDDA